MDSHRRSTFPPAGILALCLAAGAPAKDSAAPRETPEAAAALKPDSPRAEAVSAGASRDRTALNLLGEVDAAQGEARRNENVRLTLIDNNVLKELNTRIGATATIVPEFRVEHGYFGKEFGGGPSASPHVSSARAPSLHGELFWGHNNSIFSARSFFQVGGVQPARTNDYGFKAGLPLNKKTGLTFDAGGRRLRGQVNGNVLVPAADERAPTAADPARRAVVERILGAFPDELPNRTDINPRALNTNARQNIDNDRFAATLDRALGGKDRLTARYGLTLQNVEAFQLVGGQNPDTTTRSHRSRLTWNRQWNPRTVTDFSFGFDRVGSLLVPDETSLGEFFLFARILESIGPNGGIPIDRAQNLFRYAGSLKKTGGAHDLTLGFDLLRRQINGSESNEQRGKFRFRPDFGRPLIANVLAGAPSTYIVAVGNAHRGFRNWDMKFFAGDKWQIGPRLSLSAGLRFEPVTVPFEVNGLSDIPYDCDCNNFAPRLGLAWRANDRWGVLRLAYGLQYGAIFPATFMQTRFNPPQVITLDARAPNLADPLSGIDLENIDPDTRSAFFRLDPELSTPYSHQYNFTWQTKPYRDWTLELGYVGSRSHRLLQTRWNNRARPVEGVDLLVRTVNQRRPDPRFFDIQYTLNGSIGYYDAAKATLRIPRHAGLSVEASYWFGKAIDLGADYTNTAFSRDARNSRSPNELDVWRAMKAVSDFDQPHAALWRVNYQMPAAGAGRGLLRILGGWQLSAVVLLKSGTPFAVRSGSDAPGFGNVDGQTSDRPNLADPSILGVSVDHPDTAAARLPRQAFTFMAPTDFSGNLGRNTFRKDGIANVNAALSRRFALGGDRSLLFRAESLNFTNHPQFAEPGTELAAGNFAQITNTLNDGRTFRLLLRFLF